MYMRWTSMIACLVWWREKSVCKTCVKSLSHSEHNSEHDSLMKLYYLHLRREQMDISPGMMMQMTETP
jgi:hypothetical protein